MTRIETSLQADGFLSKREAAEYLSLSARSIDNLLAKGELPAFRPPIGTEHGRKLLFRRCDLDAWVERYPANQDLDQIVEEALVGMGREK